MLEIISDIHRVLWNVNLGSDFVPFFKKVTCTVGIDDELEKETNENDEIVEFQENPVEKKVKEPESLSAKV